MRNIFSYNGVLTDGDDKIFCAKNRIAKYGDGIFETIKVINKKALLFDLHFDRLTRACKLFKLEIKEKWTKEFFEEQIEILCLKNAILNARCRITIYRDTEGNYTPLSNKTSLLIEITDDIGKYVFNDKGLTLDQYQPILKPSNFTSFFKTLSSLNYVLAGIYAKENKVDSVVLFNEFGRVSETLYSNIFIVIDNEIFTPCLTEYCLDGVMRKHVIQKLEDLKYSIHESSIEELDLLMADEVFLTNSIKGIQWVESYKQKNYNFNLTQVIFNRIFKEI